MPIITKSPIVKGTPSLVTLDKTALAALSIVSSDAYFSDQSNWSKVKIIYLADGKQNEILTFDPSQLTPVAYFDISEKARDIFEVNKIEIIDFDGGSLKIPRSELNTAEFDVDLSGLSFNWLKAASVTDYGTEDGLQTSSTGAFTNGSITQAINGDFDVTMSIEELVINGDFMAGFALSNVDLSVGMAGLSQCHLINGSHDGTVMRALEFGLGMEDNPSGNFGGGTGVNKVRFIRVGSTITYELRNKSDVVFKTGNAKTGHSGAVYFVFHPFTSVTRLNSIIG